LKQVNEFMANPKGNTATLKPYQTKWNSGTTRTIRVPVVLADQVLEYAHKLDSNESLTQVNQAIAIQTDEINHESLTQVIQILTEALELKANAGGKIKDRIREAIALLR
jgi:LytS/YehU family sensor histidine kinase